ncbi:hypothetical protein [Butyrivibrio sp. INlla14]|uniref:hypothetical protein n=1 Tax=Butyrivibrio sp. INlla14 TaxID=1520808 RepID=UPI0008768309|nr:hypothetical protein [Butyrivibrio sp. INlla14]SCY74661.1 hypothetical protein SAMN02910371_03703 [Butyrivibrio sp. INlla14]
MRYDNSNFDEEKKISGCMSAKDDMDIFADFLGEMIAKYIDRLELEKLPDPDHEWLRRYISDAYHYYMKYKNRREKKEKDSVDVA